jgi:hypothetical protein
MPGIWSVPDAGGNRDYVFRDPWGNPYVITLDLNLDDRCDDAAYSPPSINAPVAIWSFGPDGRPETKDDNILSWK